MKQSRLFLILSMVIFGTIGIFRKYILMPSSALAMVRGFIGAFFLLVLFLAKGRKLSWKAIHHNLLFLLISGALLGFNWILLFEAYQYTSVATATLCYYMAPIFVILASPIFLKETLTRKKVICVAVSLVGMMMVSGVFETEFTGILELKGILLGLGAAVFYASVIILNKKIKDIEVYDKTIMQLVTAAIVLLQYVLLTENLCEISFTPVLIIMLCIVGILHTGVAYALYFRSIEDLNAQTVALFSYIDPIVAILLSALFLHEAMGALEVIGTILILGATLTSELTPNSIRSSG